MLVSLQLFPDLKNQFLNRSHVDILIRTGLVERALDPDLRAGLNRA